MVPIGLVLVLLGAPLLGHNWNAHGDALFIGAAFQLTALVALLVEVVVLARVVPWLREHPTARTPANLACTAFAAAFVLLACLWFVWAVASH